MSFYRDPRRQYRRTLWGIRGKRHAYRDAIFQAVRKAKAVRP